MTLEENMKRRIVGEAIWAAFEVLHAPHHRALLASVDALRDGTVDGGVLRIAAAVSQRTRCCKGCGKRLGVTPKQWRELARNAG